MGKSPPPCHIIGKILGLIPASVRKESRDAYLRGKEAQRAVNKKYGGKKK